MWGDVTCEVIPPFLVWESFLNMCKLSHVRSSTNMWGDARCEVIPTFLLGIVVRPQFPVVVHVRDHLADVVYHSILHILRAIKSCVRCCITLLLRGRGREEGLVTYQHELSDERNCLCHFEDANVAHHAFGRISTQMPTIQENLYTQKNGIRVHTYGGS